MRVSAAVFLIFAAACQPTANDWNVVDSRVTWFLKSPDALPDGCTSRGPQATPGLSSSRMWLVDKQAVAESNAYAQLSELAAEAGANTVLIERVAEEVPLDDNREWGLQLAGEAFDCPR